MKIETELNGTISISPDGKEGESLLYVRGGRVIRIYEKAGSLRTEQAGRAVGFIVENKKEIRRTECC